MSYSSYISKQSRTPTGIFGRFVMSFFFEKGNVELNTLVYEALSVENTDHVLEIGFGPGTLLKKIADRVEHGIVEGIDLSPSMATAARKKTRKHLKTGHMKIHVGDIDSVAFDENNFDKICAVNTLYFWARPEITISNICRLLTPGGKLVLGFHDKHDMEKMSLDPEVFHYYTPHNVADLLSIHGALQNVDVISKQGKQRMCYCAVGTK